MATPRETINQLAHNVYFTLHDPSDAARARLVEACRKYLAPHAGIVFFGAGTLAELCREVNDRDFDVALHIVFADQAAHDHYQTTPAHMQFIEENKANWKRVRVFDSVVARVIHCFANRHEGPSCRTAPSTTWKRPNTRSTTPPTRSTSAWP